MDAQLSSDPTSVWVMGVSTPGWYMAKALWCKRYATDLRELGYEVERRYLKKGSTREYVTVADDWSPNV